MAARGMFWCFTENVEPDAFRHALLSEGLPDGIDYLCGQLEKGEHLHFQGYVELPVTQRLAALKRLLSPTAHFERRMGTQDEAIEYTQKEDDTTVPGTWIELGEPHAGQGKRNDLLEVKAKLDDGVSMKAIADEHFGSWCRNHRSFEKYLLLKGNNEPRHGKVTTILIIGPSGCGKTTRVEDELIAKGYGQRNPDGTCKLDTSKVYCKTPQEKWWDDYQGQEYVWLEEHNSAWFKWDTLLRFLDPKGLPITVEFKGGSRQLRATVFFITCNREPSMWYKNPICPEALYRRISWTIRYKADHSFTVEEGYLPPKVQNSDLLYDQLPRHGFN